MTSLQMDNQFKIAIDRTTSKKLLVCRLFILKDGRYLYQIKNNNKYEWYILSENKLLKMNISKSIVNRRKEIVKVIFKVGSNQFISLRMYYEGNDNGYEKISVKLSSIGDRYYAKIDNYLYEMFYDIYRMKNA